jgi:hypothetical protein
VTTAMNEKFILDGVRGFILRKRARCCSSSESRWSDQPALPANHSIKPNLSHEALSRWETDWQKRIEGVRTVLNHDPGASSGSGVRDHPAGVRWKWAVAERRKEPCWRSQVRHWMATEERST